MSAPDERMKVLKVAVIRAGIRIPDDPDSDIRWLRDNGYLEPFEDINGNACYRISRKAETALQRGSLPGVGARRHAD